MSIETGFILLLLLIALVSFALDRIRPDLIALTVLVVLMLSGILNIEEGLSGFSNPATITVLALFLIAAVLESTGVIRSMGDLLLKISSNSTFLIVLVICVISAISSAFINTTAVVLVFLPVVLRLSKLKNISPTLLLMPLSFCAIIGGASTTIGTSTNLLISDLVSDALGRPLQVFEFSHIGIVLFIIIAIYMALASKFVLKESKKFSNLIDDYNLKKYISEVYISEKSNWIGKKLSEIKMLNNLNIDILEITRKSNDYIVPSKDHVIENGDYLLIRINQENLLLLDEVTGIKIQKEKNWKDQDFSESGILLMELMVNKNSSLIGKNLLETNFRKRYSAGVMAILSSKNKFFPKRLKQVRLRFGDNLLVETTENRKNKFYENRDFIVLNEWQRPTYRESKKLISGLVVIGVIALAAFAILPIALAALTGVCVLFLTKSIDVEEAYRSVEWKIIFMLAGLIPLGLAMEKTGTSDLISSWIVTVINPLPIFWALVALYLIINFFTSIIYNNATAIILAPVVVSVSASLQIDALVLTGLLMFSANCCFITPIGYQTNLIIYGPGQYKFRDFFIIGFPLTLILAFVSAYLVLNFL